MLAGVGDVREELLAVGHFQLRSRCRRPAPRAYTCTGKDGAGTIAVSPGPNQRQAHVAEAFLGAQADDRLGLGIEPHAVLLEILAATSRRRF